MKKEVFDSYGKRLAIISSVYYILAVILMSVITGTELYLVFLGLFPLLLYQILFFVLSIYEFKNYQAIWIMPLVLPISFLVLWRTGYFEILNMMEGPTLTVINILLSYLANALFLFFDKDEVHMLRERIKKYKKALDVNKGNFSVRLRGIEDKCKAINFVIGRVYSDKKNGNKTIRERLKINREMYNSFSEITANFKKTDIDILSELLMKLYLKLTTLELTESEVIGKSIYGNMRIIDILNQYDKDPALEYYSEAKEICVNLINYLRKK